MLLNMKKILAFTISMFTAVVVLAQVEDPVRWSFSSKKIGDKTYEIRLTALIEPGWHVYSQTTPDGGPVKTSIDFTKNPLVTLQGNIKEIGKMEQHFEKLFGVQVKQFSDKVDFVQKIILKAKVKTSINGTVEFMSCNDHECLPPVRQKFTLAIK